ncbi:MAG: phosphopantetheine-binding protein, partial [Bacteroidota bacterium]
VLAKADHQGALQLIAYLVCEPPFEKQLILQYLKSQLPAYMVPALLQPLEALPLKPNGKLDKDSLPSPDWSALQEQYVAPRNSLETKLAEIWQNLLNVEKVGIQDNFFELGGHSLLATRLASHIRQELAIDISANTLFRYNTIADLHHYFRMTHLIQDESEDNREYDFLVI